MMYLMQLIYIPCVPLIMQDYSLGKADTWIYIIISHHKQDMSSFITYFSDASLTRRNYFHRGWKVIWDSTVQLYFSSSKPTFPRNKEFVQLCKSDCCPLTSRGLLNLLILYLRFLLDCVLLSPVSCFYMVYLLWIRHLIGYWQCLLFSYISTNGFISRYSSLSFNIIKCA